MERRLGIFLVCVLVWFSVAVGQFRLGIQAGVNYARLTPPEDLPPSVEWKTLPGVTVGAIAEIPLGGHLFLQAEPRYIEKGFKYETKGKFHTATVIETITYVDLSLLLKARLADSSFRPFLFAGPSVAFLISATEGGTLLDGSTFPDFDVESSYKPNDVALEFGLGFEYSLTPRVSIFPAIRYSMGLHNIYLDPGNSGMTRGLQISAGVIFLTN